MKKSFGAVGFYERLREEIDRQVGRKEEGKRWTQTQFAEHVLGTTGYDLKQHRVSALRVKRYESYNPLEIEAVCAGLGISPAWLMFQQGDKQGLSVPESKEKHGSGKKIELRKNAGVNQAKASGGR